MNFTQLRLLTLLIVCIGVVLSTFIADIQYRSEITDYFRQDDSRVQNFHKLESTMGMQQSLLVLLEQKQESFLTRKGVTALYEVNRTLLQVPGIQRVDSILSSAITDRQGNTLSLYNFIKSGNPLSNSIMGQMADNSASNSVLLSKDNQLATLSIYFDNPEAVALAYPIIQSTLEQNFSGNHFMLGPVQIKQALHEALLHDGFYLMPLVLVLGLGVLWYFLRSYWLVIAGAISIIAAIWITAGIAGALKLTINQTSSLAFCIAFIIALADVIHLLMSFTHQPATLSNQQAMMNSLRSNGLSLFLTSLTTGIGFLSLNGSSSPVFATFGNIAAIGVACAFLTAITLTPVLTVLRETQSRQNKPDFFQQLVQSINQLRPKLRLSHYLIFYCLSILISCGILLNQYHNDPLDYFERDSAIIQATNLSEQQFNIHHPISIHLDAGGKDGIFHQDFLSTVYRLQNWLDAHPIISSQTNFITTLGSLKRHLHENNLKWASPPLDSTTAADLWNVYQMAAPENTPASIGLDDKFRSAVISVGIPKLSSQQLLALEKEIINWLQTNASEYQFSVTGHALLFASIGKELTTNMFIGGLLSAMVISILIGLFLGNLKLGILSLIPNLFPAGIVYGLWGASVGVIDIAAAGTLSISLGIVVDDSIHILKRYLGFRKTGFNVEQAINQTFEQVGSALMLTTLILSIGMAVLTLSIFGPNQTTAFIMTGIIIVALLYDLFMLPHLLQKLDNWLLPNESNQPLELAEPA